MQVYNLNIRLKKESDLIVLIKLTPSYPLKHHGSTNKKMCARLTEGSADTLCINLRSTAALQVVQLSTLFQFIVSISNENSQLLLK